MNRRIALCALLVAFSLVSFTSAAEPVDKSVKLFNGKNLKGWTHFLVDDKAKMSDVWSVNDGLLICKGEPMGYLATKKKFKNFKLVVEWRWAPGKKPGNSGVLMRITGKPTMLPNCMEAQLKSGNAGDMYGFQGFKIDGPSERRKDVEGHKLAGHLRALSRSGTNEKEPRQWNKYEITVDGEKVTLIINGKQVNQAMGCDVRAGQIGLQSEGGEIHFRTVTLTPLD